MPASAVLVNDFGAINIDAELVESRETSMVGLENGCICCSVGGDCIAALALLRDRADLPRHVVVEAGGVADPRAISAARPASQLVVIGLPGRRWFPPARARARARVGEAAGDEQQHLALAWRERADPRTAGGLWSACREPGPRRSDRGYVADVMATPHGSKVALFSRTVS
jgi:CobW/HypB/UreG family nucleotide-binding protein